MAEINVIVLDNGSDTIKAGYCIPERDPLLVTPSAVRLAADGGAGGSGSDAPPGELLRPIRRGVVQDWDALESLYHHIFYERLGWKPGEEGAVLVSEPLLTSKAHREQLTQLLFEQFNVAGLYVADAPVLALYATGKLTGSVVDIGAEKIDICPVFEGAPFSPGARRLEFGGRDIDAHLQQLLRASGLEVDVEAARGIKEAQAFTAESAAAYEAAMSQAREPVQHTLPDGTAISLPQPALACAGEVPFAPTGMTGQPAAGLTEELLVSVKTCIPDVRRQMLESVLVCGGGSRVRGLDARLLSELTAAAPAVIRPSLVQCPEYMPENTLRYASFIGGAILAKTVFPQNQHVTKHDYHEMGPTAVSRRMGAAHRPQRVAPRRGRRGRRATRMIPARLKPFALKFFFSNQYLYAHVQRRADGVIVAAASTIEKTLRESLPSRTDVAAAAKVGELLAERSKAAGVESVLFEKPRGRPFHGRMAALVQGVQKGGVALK